MTNLFAFPEHDEEISVWLEQIIISPNLEDAVSQLSILGHGKLTDEPSEIPSDRFQYLVKNGLGDLTTPQCRWLLRNPKQLLVLNEQIFESGSAYWLQKLAKNSADEEFLAQVSGLLTAAPIPSPSQPKEVFQSTQARRSFFRSASTKVWVVAATLLGLLLGVPAYQAWVGEGAASDWGWQTVRLTENSPRKEYLRSLDSSVLEWFEVSKGSPKLLATRIEQLSEGCNRLINAKHHLPESDSEWLLEKCRLWKVKIDDLAASASKTSNTEELNTIQSHVDDVVSKISLAFQHQIESPI